jgi:signal transduction histidine kinase
MVVDSRAPRGFLSTLLHDGVNIVAITEPLPSEQVADPVPVPAWRRMARLARPTDSPATATAVGFPRLADLTRRAARYLLLGPMAFRLLAIPVPVAVLATRYGVGRLAPVLLMAAALAALNVAMIAALVFRPGYADRRSLLVGDLILVVAANILAGRTVPGSPDVAFHDVFWAYLIGTVVLWAAAWGLVASLLPLGLSVPTQLAMIRFGAPGGTVAGAVGRFLWLVLALAVTALVLALIGLGIRLALAVGMRAGRVDERTRMLRGLHDTILPALEAMALRSGPEQARPADALAEVRAMARQQAALLRHSLGELAERREQRLADELAEVVGEAVGGGLDVDLVVADMDGHDPGTASREALRGAVREALRNVRKHARCRAAVVRVEEADGGLRVVVRDHGCGFDAAADRFGFGITESILARLCEVGGHAGIESRPGNGTRVTLWVPR